MSTAFCFRPAAGTAAVRSSYLCSNTSRQTKHRSLPVCSAQRKDEDRTEVVQCKHTDDVEKWAPGKGHQRMFMTTLLASGMGGVMGLLPDLQGPISTLQAILILCAIVAFHELGHFTAARVQGIHVSKFAIGFGPSLWSYKPGDVEYSVRAFPLGGFVAFPDNDEDCPYPEDDPDLLKNRPIIDRFWVISAGVPFVGLPNGIL